MLDDGEHTDDFAEWSAYHQIRLAREAILQTLSHVRLQTLRQTANQLIVLNPCEPTLRLSAPGFSFDAPNLPTMINDCIEPGKTPTPSRITFACPTLFI